MNPFPWDKTPTLITGASSGLGTAFAKNLASQKCPLMITARREQRLNELKKELEERGAPRVEVVVEDLTQPHAAKRLKQACQERDFSTAALINNAGLGWYGSWTDQSYENENSIMQVNVLSVLQLTRELIPLIEKAPRGLILNVSSIAAFVSLPGISVYSASKAFVNSWSFALRRELQNQGTNIFVHTLCPGPTVSEFASVASGRPNFKPKGRMSAEEAISYCLKQIDKEKMLSIPGVKNKITTLIPRFLSWRVQTWLASRLKKRPAAKTPPTAASCAQDSTDPHKHLGC